MSCGGGRGLIDMTSETHAPSVELDAPYSAPAATATPWDRAQATLSAAAIYWLSTVRADGRPHVTPVIAVWSDGALHFCTGPAEQKAQNLAGNANVVVTTGNNSWSGLDVVVEGAAARVTDDGTLNELAATWIEKYGEEWRFDVADGSFHHSEGEAHVFAVAPAKVFAYDRDEPGGATRYRF
jgi:nitroimidazol reductase NimA-like FMN-containing flavoprotein (pyridoxamine 5'-phosphate oxidase superfamily)